MREPPARGTERRADRDLTLARRRAGDEQARDVDARDEKHETDCAEQHEQRTTRVADGRGAETLDVDEQIAAPVPRFAPALGIALGHLTHDVGERRLALRRGYAVPESAKRERVEVVGALIHHRRREAEREEDVGDRHSKTGQRKSEAGRHDADHFGGGAAGEGDLLADHRWIGAIPATPERVTDDDDRWRARGGVCIEEGTSNQRSDLQYLERRRRDRRAIDHLRIAVHDDGRASRLGDGERLERAAFRFLVVEEICRRDSVDVGGEVRDSLAHNHQPI